MQTASEQKGGEKEPATIHVTFMDRFIADTKPMTLTGCQLDRIVVCVEYRKSQSGSLT